MRRLAALLEEEWIRIATLCGDADRALAECARAGLSLEVGAAAEAALPVSSLRGDGHALIAARILIRIDRPQDALTFLQVAEQARGYRQLNESGTEDGVSGVHVDRP